MKGSTRDVRDLLETGEFRPQRHMRLLPEHARAAYARAGGGNKGRQAALDALSAGEDTVGDLHHRAYATGEQLMAIRYGGSVTPDSPGCDPARQALWDELAESREAYKRAVSPSYTNSGGSVDIPAPEDETERAALEEALWERIRSLPDRDEMDGSPRS